MLFRSPADRKFLCILWREALNERVKIFELNAVTYAMSFSPYLAIRVVRQLAEDEETKFPLAAPVFARETYVDEFVFWWSRSAFYSCIERSAHSIGIFGWLSLT